MKMAIIVDSRRQVLGLDGITMEMISRNPVYLCLILDCAFKGSFSRIPFT